MTSFSPDVDGKRAHSAMGEIDQRLKDSFAYLLDMVGDRLTKPDKFRLQAHQAPSLKGAGHVIHHSLVKAIEDGEAPLLERVDRAMAQWSPSPEAMRVTALFDGDRSYDLDTLYFDICDEGSRRTYGIFLDAGPLSPNERMASKPALQHAVNRWRQVDPDGAAEADVLLSDLILVHSMTSNAGSSAHALGYVRFSHLKPGQTWTRYYEALAHEAGHQILNLLLSLDPMIDNDHEKLHRSPLRREPRPLTAILHAGFVLARTLRAIRRLERAPDYDRDTETIRSEYNNAGNPDSFERKFEDCYETLESNARFTEAGARFFRDLRALAYDA